MSNEKKTAVFIFAAGKSSRMKTGKSKMLENVIRDGIEKPMILHSVETFKRMGFDVYLLIGFDGTNVKNATSSIATDFLRVSSDDGNDLKPTSSGTLQAFSKDIIVIAEKYDHVIMSVGDQPYMRQDTLMDFYKRHLMSKKDATILLANLRNTPLESATYTRVTPIGNGIWSFFTPDKNDPFEGLSTLADVGVVVISNTALKYAIDKIDTNSVFGTIICHLAEGGFSAGKVEAYDPYQFTNVNEKKDKTLDIPLTILPVPENEEGFEFVDNSELFLKWLEWHVLKKRTSSYSIFDYQRIYKPEFEMDTSLFCRGTPACLHDCTYRNRHLKASDPTAFMNCGRAQYIIEKAWDLGFKGILFSGGGENLEPESYANFLSIARFAKDTGYKVSLATNGVNLNSTMIAELSELLGSIRFSIPPKTLNHAAYSHVGRIADVINQMHKYISMRSLETNIYANVLMSPTMDMAELEATILMLSQLGVDSIRFKAIHEYQNGQFTIRPQQYTRHIQLIRNINQNKKYKMPDLVISKLDEMLNDKGPFPFDYCYYRDFNPLVVGCNAHNYACCELKYEEPPFDLGEIDESVDNLEMLCRPTGNPQEITSKCFRGCKGYLINKDIQKLINEYKQFGNALFSINTQNAEIRDRVVPRLARTVISN